MSSHATETVTPNGAFTRPVTAVISDDYLAPTSSHSVVAQATMTLGLLTGLWVAVSPWFLVLQHGGNNAAVSNLIVGLAVAALGLYALSGSRGFLGLQFGSALAGVWLIISPFILDAKFAIATPMYWSNVFTGALVVLIGLAAIAETRRASSR
jgi:hypothetical protein